MTIPRALADWVRKPTSLQEAESRDPAAQRGLALKAQLNSHIIGMTAHRAMIELDQDSARIALAVIASALADPQVSDAGKGAIARAATDIARAFPQHQQ